MRDKVVMVLRQRLVVNGNSDLMNFINKSKLERPKLQHFRDAALIKR